MLKEAAYQEKNHFRQYAKSLPSRGPSTKHVTLMHRLISSASTELHIAAFFPKFPEPQFQKIFDAAETLAHFYLPTIIETELVFRRYVGRDNLQPGRFDIPESIGPKLELPLTHVFVPGLLFSYRGGRLGRGGGFYDRFLSRSDAITKDTRLIGICHDNQIVETIPMEAHDQKVQALLTESGIMPVLFC